VQELIERFIRVRTYFKNVSPETQSWYRQSFRAFDGAIETRTAIGDRYRPVSRTWRVGDLNQHVSGVCKCFPPMG